MAKERAAGIHNGGWNVWDGHENLFISQVDQSFYEAQNIARRLNVMDCDWVMCGWCLGAGVDHGEFQKCAKCMGRGGRIIERCRCTSSSHALFCPQYVPPPGVDH